MTVHSSPGEQIPSFSFLSCRPGFRGPRRDQKPGKTKVSSFFSSLDFSRISQVSGKSYREVSAVKLARRSGQTYVGPKLLCLLSYIL
jgi:hypothetical protein